MHISNELFTLCISISASGFVEMESQVKNQCWMKGGEYFSFPVRWKTSGKSRDFKDFYTRAGRRPEGILAKRKIFQSQDIEQEKN